MEGQFEMETESMPIVNEAFADSEMNMSEDGTVDAEMNLDQSQPAYQEDDAQMETNENQYGEEPVNSSGLPEENIDVEIEGEAVQDDVGQQIQNGDGNGNDSNMNNFASDPKEVEMQSNSSSPKFQPHPSINEDTNTDQVAEEASSLPHSHPTNHSDADPRPSHSDNPSLGVTLSQPQKASNLAETFEKEATEDEYGERNGAGEDQEDQKGKSQGEGGAGVVEEETAQDQQAALEDSHQDADGAEEETEQDDPESVVNQPEGDQTNSVDESIPSIRISFNGQDFVLFPSSSSSPTYIGLDLSADPNTGEEVTEQQQHLTIEVSAPPLRAPGDTFYSPLDALFEAFRVKDALGDFLEEGTEIIMWLPELELTVREDDVYAREISLEDLHRLHVGCGIHTSMHIELSEGQRFISRYNSLAAEVGGMMGNELAKEGEEQSSKQVLAADEGTQDQYQAHGNTEGSSNQHEGDADATTTSKAARIQQAQDEEEDEHQNEEFETYDTALPFNSSNTQGSDLEHEGQEEEVADTNDVTEAGDETFVTTVDGHEDQHEAAGVEGGAEGGRDEESQAEEGLDHEEPEDQDKNGNELDGGERGGDGEVVEYTEDQEEDEVVNHEDGGEDGGAGEGHEGLAEGNEGYAAEIHEEDGQEIGEGEVTRDGGEEILEYEEEKEEDPSQSAPKGAASVSDTLAEDSVYGEQPASNDPVTNGNHQGSSDDHQTLAEVAAEAQPNLKTKRSHEDAYGELNGGDGEGEVEEADSKRTKIQ